MSRTIPLALLVLVSPRPGRPRPGRGRGPPPVSFLKDVAPILVENCVGCHNPKKAESEYDMTNFAALVQGRGDGRGHHDRAGRPGPQSTSSS